MAIYDIAAQTSYNRVALGCTADENIALITTWNGRDIENGSTLRVYSPSRTLLRAYTWFDDGWALDADLT